MGHTDGVAVNYSMYDGFHSKSFMFCVLAKNGD